MDGEQVETADGLVRAATERGYSVAPSTIKQWYAFGLLPQFPAGRSRQRRRERGRGGSEAIFPAGTLSQLLRVLAIRAEDGAAARRFDRERALWRLWWEGWSVEPLPLTARLRTMLTGWEVALAEVEAGAGLGAALDADRPPPLFAEARKRGGRGGLLGLADVLGQTTRGGSVGAWRLKRGGLYESLGLADFHRSIPTPEGNAATADIAMSLGRLAAATSPTALQAALDSAGEADLDLARANLRAVASAAGAFWPVVALLLPASNMGSDLRAAFEHEYSELLPAAALYVLALRRNQTYAAILDALNAAPAFAAALAQAMRAQEPTEKEAPPRPLKRSGGMTRGRKGLPTCATSLRPSPSRRPPPATASSS